MNNDKKKILIITYVWPPFAAVGVYRILKFCKYLRDFGIEPVIYSATNPNTMSRDENLKRQIPNGIRVYRSFSPEPFRWRQSKSNSAPKAKSETGKAGNSETINKKPSVLSRIKKSIRMHLTLPDNVYFWSWSGIGKGIKAVRDENIKLILSSAPPQSVHILGSRISRSTGVSHLADFRDLWTQNAKIAERKLPSYLERKNRNLELSVLKHASGVTVNTDSFKNQILAKNDFLDKDMIEVITNGVDPDDFNNIPRKSNFNDRFTIVYTGSLYRQRDPEFFFNALQAWLDRRPEIKEKVRAEFIGNWATEHESMLDKYNLDGTVERKGWMPQQEAIEATFQADLLLLIQGFDPDFAAAMPPSSKAAL